MSLTNAAETDLLDLLFANQAWANIGDVGGLLPSAADGDFYISLHDASPGEAGNQTTNETNYGSYVRVAVSRDATSWSVGGGQATNLLVVTFIRATSAPSPANPITHLGVGTDFSGTGNLLVFGALSSSIAVVNGSQPEFAIGALVMAAD